MVFWHTPSGAYYGGKRQGAIMKSLGARAGVSDLLLFHEGQLFCLEIKSEGGRLSESQMQFLSDMGKAGAFTGVAVGLDAALRALETWQLLLGEAQ